MRFKLINAELIWYPYKFYETYFDLLRNCGFNVIYEMASETTYIYIDKLDDLVKIAKYFKHKLILDIENKEIIIYDYFME